MAELNGQESYQFDDFRLIPGEGLLLRDGKPVSLTPKAFETLLFLVRSRGHLVQKAELMDKVWGDAFVEENAVSKCVWSIRNALGEDPRNPKFIQTVPKRGYRFVAEVETSSEPELPPAEISSAPARSSVEMSGPPKRSEQFRPILISTVVFALVVLGLSAWAFRGWLPVSGDTPTVKSLTVIPLENASGDPSEDYFVEGITDALIGDLARISELQVISLPTELRLPSATRDLRAIGQRLNVDGVLTGSVSRSGERVRISMQLVHASTGRNLWARTYERDLRGVQSIGGEVARTIANEIRITITPKELERLGSPHGVNPEAYDQYLRGRYFLNKQNPKDQDTAIVALERAVEMDPSFAAAYAELAQAYTWKHFSFAPDQPELAEKAFIATEKALSLDPNAATAYLARGRWQWTPDNHFPHEKAIIDYKRALGLNPNLGEARNQLALVYCHVGLLDEALREAREGVRIDPTNNLLQLRIGQTLNSQAKYEDALAVLRAIPKGLHPSVVGHQTAWALFNLGRIEEAAAKVEQLLIDHPDTGGTFASMQAVMAAADSRHAEAEALIRRAIEKGKGFGHFHHTAYTIACAYALMNKRNEAIKWLEIAAETGFPCYPTFEVDRNLDNLRGDPRFVSFLERLRGQWEHFKSLDREG
jgi:TolB-like protein/DNA-binding winged helix-turn-helix (wHTH) protein/Tfp pilus assembly protein PilF